MRSAFINKITSEVSKNKDIFIITGDAGLGVFDNFKNESPDNFINLGVAEQNATGFAAGMAIAGFKVYIYNIIPFLLYRTYEQVRNDICYQNLAVTLVGIGSGVTYAPQGMTHYSIEDIAIARTLPNLTVISPSDPIEAELSAEYSLTSKNPVYVRLAKRGEPNIHMDKNINITEPILMKDGEEVCLIFHGSIGTEVMDARKELLKEGISVKVVSIPMLNPINESLLIDTIGKVKHVISIEEHYIIGGLGSILFEIFAINKINNYELTTLGITHRFIHEIKDQNGMRKLFGLSKNSIVAVVKNILGYKIL